MSSVSLHVHHSSLFLVDKCPRLRQFHPPLMTRFLSRDWMTKTVFVTPWKLSMVFNAANATSFLVSPGKRYWSFSISFSNWIAVIVSSWAKNDRWQPPKSRFQILIFRSLEPLINRRLDEEFSKHKTGWQWQREREKHRGGEEIQWRVQRWSVGDWLDRSPWRKLCLSCPSMAQRKNDSLD